MNIKKAQKGFTLIELLIVIVVIGILAGVIITVINPAQIQRKARETVLRTNVEKGCYALVACGSTSSNAQSCDTYDEVGITHSGGIPTANGTPTGSTYLLDDATPAVLYVSGGAAVGATLYYGGTLNTCSFSCGFNFTSDQSVSMVANAGCLIDVGN